jgi:hypothetical protein
MQRSLRALPESSSSRRLIPGCRLRARLAIVLAAFTPALHLVCDGQNRLPLKMRAFIKVQAAS